MAWQTFLEKQFDPKGTIASGGVSVLVFLRKPMATCNLTGASRPLVPHSESTHDTTGFEIEWQTYDDLKYQINSLQDKIKNF